MASAWLNFSNSTAQFLTRGSARRPGSCASASDDCRCMAPQCAGGVLAHQPSAPDESETIRDQTDDSRALEAPGTAPSITAAAGALIKHATLSPTQSFYIGPKGSDVRGNGSRDKPWATLEHALRSVPDNGSEIVFLDGTYTGTRLISRQFQKPLRIRAETPYQARWTSSPRRHRVLHLENASNMVISGFEMHGQDGPKDDYLIQVTGELTFDVVLTNNILHDSYKNDILKINSRAHHITVHGNMFYNQPQGGDEHIDVNTVYDVIVEDNVFFNDFAASGRPVRNNTHPFVLIKNSGGKQVSKDFVVRGNVFLNWQGLPDQPFLLLGEDAKPFHEAQRVLVENNVFLGTTRNPMTAVFAVKGVKDVVYRANTAYGDFPLGAKEWGYAMRRARRRATRRTRTWRFTTIFGRLLGGRYSISRPARRPTISTP